MKKHLLVGLKVGTAAVASLLLNIALHHLSGLETSLSVAHLPYGFLGGFVAGTMLAYVKSWIESIGV
jgi:hypothetical protein